MPDDEPATMQEHAAYWGPGVVEVEDEAAVQALPDGDPAVASGLCTAEDLPVAVGFSPG